MHSMGTMGLAVYLTASFHYVLGITMVWFGVKGNRIE
jgi:hypothetical protein